MPRFGVHEVADVTFIDLSTNKPALFLDSLKLSNLENNADTSYAQGGKGNARLLAWDYNRTVAFNIQDALLNPKSIAMQTGNDLQEGSVNIHKREVLTAETSATAGQTKVTTSETIISGTVTVYKTTDGYEHGTEVTPVSASDNTIEFADTDVAAGDKVIVYYEFSSSVTAQTIVISSDKFPGYYKVIGDTVVRNESTGEDEPFQIFIAKAKIQPGFTFTMQPDGDPSVFNFNIDVFKPSDNTEMVKMIKY